MREDLPQSTGYNHQPCLLGGAPMSVSHLSDGLQPPSLWRLAQCVRPHQDQWPQREAPPDLERFERALPEHGMAIERDLLADERSREEVAADEVTVEGVSSRRSLESTQPYLSAAGPITVRRHLSRPAGRRTKSMGPLERRAGIVQGLWQPIARVGRGTYAPVKRFLKPRAFWPPPSMGSWRRWPRRRPIKACKRRKRHPRRQLRVTRRANDTPARRAVAR